MTGMSRADAQRLAEAAISSVDAALAENRRCSIPHTLDRLTLVGALKRILAQRVADALQTGLPKPHQRLKNVALGRVYRIRACFKNSLDAARGRGRFIDGGRRVVLAVPREDHHLRDMLPVARMAARRWNLRFAWLTYRNDHYDLLAREGQGVVLAGAYAHAEAWTILRVRAELLRQLLRSRSSPPPELSSTDWATALTTIGTESLDLAGPTLDSAAALRRTFEELRPQAVLVGNPCTPDGSLARALARGAGVPSMAMQHGEIGRTHTEWLDADVDRLTVWGNRVEAVLKEMGVPSERLVVTGAPWVDRLDIDKAPVARPRKRILVALSGAGHVVGMQEHLTHVRMLLEVSSKLRAHDWLFRLHRKDDPELYHRIAAEIPGARPTIQSPGSRGPSIHEQLAETDLLITVTSASALDAMLHGVPVITLGRPEGEYTPAYVQARATAHVPLGQSMVDAVKAALARDTATVETCRRARSFVAEYFGPSDGKATERVVEALLEIAH